MTGSCFDKTSFLILNCLWILCFSCKQRAVPDALAQTDSVRITGFYAKGKEALRTGDTVAAQSAFEEGLRQSEAAGAPLLEGFGWAWLTSYHTQTGHYDAARGTGAKALRIFDSLKYQEGLYLQTRLELLSQLQLSNAHLRLTEEGLRILAEAKAAQDTPAMARALVLMGSAGTEITGDDRELRYQEKAVALLRQTSDPSTLPMTLNNLSLAYCDHGREAEALELCREALAHPKPDLRVDGYTYAYMGRAFLGLGEIDSARFYLDQSGEIAHRYNDPKMKLNLLGLYAGMYQEEGRYAKAIARFDSGIRLMEQTGITALLPAFQLGRGEAFQASGDHRQALRAYVTADSMLAALREESVRKEIAALETRYQTREKEAAIQNLSRTTMQQRAWLIGVGGLLALTVVLGTFAGLQYRKQRRANQLVAAQAEYLGWLMKEIHHRLKNNLQVITSLINMQIRKGVTPETEQVLSDTVMRIHAIALIHQKLYQHTAQETVSLEPYLRLLVDSIQSVHGPAQADIRTLLQLDTSTVVLLGLLLTELITNSYKHGRQPDRELHITIELTATPDGYRLLYTDNGPGMPQPVSLPAKTMGTTIIQLMARQLGGHFVFENKAGLRGTLLFKDEAQRRQQA